jgi:hypothetical protein
MRMIQVAVLQSMSRLWRLASQHRCLLSGKRPSLRRWPVALPEIGSKISLNEKRAQNAVSRFAMAQTGWKRCEGRTLVR